MNLLYNCVEMCLFVNTSPLTTRRFGLTLAGNQTLSWMRTIASQQEQKMWRYGVTRPWNVKCDGGKTCSRSETQNTTGSVGKRPSGGACKLTEPRWQRTGWCTD